MDAPDNPPLKMQTGGAGLGEVSQQMLDDRARELARMDGRVDFNERDLQQARTELQGFAQPPAPPETAGGAEELVEWDESPAASGHQTPTYQIDDEANIGEVLVQEGVDEAEHSQRVAASQDLLDEVEDDGRPSK
jgi:hypothetical protein